MRCSIDALLKRPAWLEFDRLSTIWLMLNVDGKLSGDQFASLDQLADRCHLNAAHVEANPDYILMCASTIPRVRSAWGKALIANTLTHSIGYYVAPRMPIMGTLQRTIWVNKEAFVAFLRDVRGMSNSDIKTMRGEIDPAYPRTLDHLPSAELKQWLKEKVVWL